MWEQLISSRFVPLAAEPVRSEDFHGALASRSLQELVLTKVDATSQSVRRTPEQVAAGDAPFYKLNLQVAGHGVLVQDGRESVLSPGDLAIYDTQRPYTLAFEEEFSTLVLLIPQHMLGLAPDDVADLTAVRMGAGHRLCRAVSPFLTQLSTLLPDLDGPIAHRLASNVVDLLSTVLADEIYSRPGGAADDGSRQLRRIHRFIESQLDNPVLTPSYVAKAHYMSVRSLHKLFESSGSTVGGWIRDQRLERCRRDLADPLLDSVPVSMLGARWAFKDPAHFSRTFRAEYGVSPAQYRRARTQLGRGPLPA